MTKWIALLLLVLAPSRGSTETPSELLLHLDEATVLSALSAADRAVEESWTEGVLRRSFVRLDMGVLRRVDEQDGALAIRFNLFPDADWVVLLRPDHDWRWRLWRGSVDGVATSRVVLVQPRARALIDEATIPVRGTIAVNDRRYEIRSVGRATLPGLHVVEEIDPTYDWNLSDDMIDVPPPPVEGSDPPEGAAVEPAPRQDPTADQINNPEPRPTAPPDFLSTGAPRQGS